MKSFGRSLIRKLKKCFTGYKPTESASGSKERSCNLSETISCGDGGYSEMIQDAISYCKNSLIKVANFEYIDEVEAAAEEEARKASTENKTTTNNPDRASYWEELLKERYEVHKVEDFNAMGKGNRSRKQEELNDIIRYGSKELFADENDEAGKSRQIHYDDAAIDRLLNRDHLGDEDATMDDEEDDGFLKAFKVANFEYIDEVEAAAEEEARKASTENKTTTNNPDRASYWEEMLKDRYEVHKVEDFNAMGKGNRSRKQVMIYRLITRGTIEERMMQMTKKKMVLEHLVVGRLKAQNINQKLDVNEPAREQTEPSTTGHWEEKELVSRDGQAKLKANVFFASFDQRSDKAVGESACTALAAVIASWLQSNQDKMPTRAQFDRLIVEGSSKWRKLCDNQDLINQFPNKHFDIETVLQARLCPISVLHEKSFIGFFGPEKFETLKGVMSFDQIWDEIKRNAEGGNDMPRIYIVSWNDHFFVLKVDVNACYIIDTFGERLFEGCNQAYILRFDDSALMRGKVEKEGVSSDQASEDEICSGKECCREFMKRFLAAIPLRELESEEKKEPVSYLALHQQLQIEFNFTTSLSLSSSSSPSSTNSTSSLFSNESTNR